MSEPHGLSSLPHELLVQVFENLGGKDLKNLSLVDSVRRSLCQPLLYSGLHLMNHDRVWTPDNKTIRRINKHILTALALGEMPLTSLVRHLSLSACDGGVPQVLDANLFTFLCQVGKSLKSLTLWELQIDDSMKIASFERKGLHLPHLEHLELFNSEFMLPLVQSSTPNRLRHLGISCRSKMLHMPTSLTSLNIGCSHYCEPLPTTEEDDDEEEEQDEDEERCACGSLEEVLLRNQQIEKITTYPYNIDGLIMPMHKTALALLNKHLVNLRVLSLDLIVSYGWEQDSEESIHFKTLSALDVVTTVAKFSTLQSLRLNFTTYTLWSESAWRGFHGRTSQELAPLTELRLLSLHIKSGSNRSKSALPDTVGRHGGLLACAKEYAATLPTVTQFHLEEKLYLKGGCEASSAFCHFHNQASGLNIKEVSLESAAFHSFQKVFKANEV